MPIAACNSHKDLWYNQGVEAPENITSAKTTELSPVTRKKPFLEPPPAFKGAQDAFSLGFELDKLDLQAASLQLADSKSEIESAQKESDELHKKRLEEMKKAIREQEKVKNWGVATSVFSWLGSILGIITGIALVATGVGAVSGALLITGGVLTLGSQVMELAGGWKALSDVVPGATLEERRAIVNWIQIAITIFSLITAAAGAIIGGFKEIGESMTKATYLIGGITTAGMGFCQIGNGINDSAFHLSIAEVRRFDAFLTRLKHLRDSSMERVEATNPRIEQIYQSLASSLGQLDEINDAYQSAWK